MKKLRFFDSLKFVRAIFVAVATAFILNIAHADTTAIQSVIAYGKTEQSATPTPTTPVPIMTNNGVLKVSPNLFDETQLLSAGWTLDSSGYYTGSFSRFLARFRNGFTFSQPFKENTQYTLTCNGYATGSLLRFIVRYTDGSSKNWDINTRAATDYVFVSEAAKTISRIDGSYGSGNDNNGFLKDVKVMEGTSADGVYVDGLTETIRDSAGHTATAQMLLGLNDTYRDEQNITTGAITRKVGVKVLDGTGTWGSSSTYGAAVFLQSAASNEFSPAAAKEKIISNYFVGEGVASSSTTHPENTCFFNLSGHLYFRTSKTPAEFKQWVADQYAAGTPVIVVYPLATETTENVTAQTLTTAPVRQTLGAIMNMPIKTILTDNTEIMSGAEELIKIATTKYNEESFEDVQDALTGVFNAVDTVVTQTMSQAQQIDQIANNKQTRPNEGCTAKYCLLVEDEDGTPHWYPIAGANGVAHNLPAGYTELEYLQTDGNAYIDTGILLSNTDTFEITFQSAQGALAGPVMGAVSGGASYTSTSNLSVTYNTASGINAYSVYCDGAAGNSNYSWNGGNRADGLKHTIKYNGLNIAPTIDGVAMTQVTPKTLIENNPTVTTWLFGRNTTGAGTMMSQNGVRIYDFYVYNKGHFIPARRSSDGVLGMYDLANPNPSTAFHTNAGTGVFGEGPVVE